MQFAHRQRSRILPYVAITDVVVGASTNQRRMLHLSRAVERCAHHKIGLVADGTESKSGMEWSFPVPCPDRAYQCLIDRGGQCLEAKSDKNNQETALEWVGATCC